MSHNGDRPDAASAPAAPQRLERGDGAVLAYHRVRGPDNGAPGVVWLGGFHSDMGGTKALALDAWARAQGRSYVRFDYFGHGESAGAFEDGTISHWRDDALAVLDALTTGPQVLVGSSMGGWLALLAALARPQRVAGLVLIAPAPDFTQRLMWDVFADDVRAEIETTGRWMRPSAYGEDPYPVTRALIEDGRRHLLLDQPSLPIRVPVRILHGLEDADVPWTLAHTLMEKLESADVTLTLVKGGDHRLSEPAQLSLLTRTVAELAGV